MTYSEGIAFWVSAACAQDGLTFTQLSETLGVTRGMPGRWIRLDRTITIDRVDAITEIVTLLPFAGSPPYSGHIRRWLGEQASVRRYRSLAADLGVPHSQLVRWVRGERPLTTARLDDLCKVLDARPVEFSASLSEKWAERQRTRRLQSLNE